MKNRTVIGILCIILSAAVMFGISPFINKMSSGKMEVIQVNKHINQGQIITSDDITKIDIGSFGVKDGVIKDQSQIVGKYAANDIIPNINIYPEMLKDTADGANDVLKTLNGAKQAISVTIDNFGNGLSGKLQNGDIISVIVVDENQSSIPAELTYVKVITTTTAKGADSDNLTKNDDGTVDLPTTVTLLVNSEQAKKLAFYDEKTKLHLSLVYRGNTDTANKFLDEQEKIFTSEVKTDE